MGDMTLQQFEEDLLFQLIGQSLVSIGRGTEADGRTRLWRWINQSYRHVSMPRVYRHPELQTSTTLTLVANDYDYATSAGSPARDLQAIYSVRWENSLRTMGLKLTPNSIRRFDERTRGSITGPPREYATWTNQVVVWPTPGTADAGGFLDVRGWLRPTLLSANAHVTAIAPEFDPAILIGAAWRGWRYLDELARAEDAKIAFAEEINEVTNRLGLEGEDTYSYVEFEVDDVMDVTHG